MQKLCLISFLMIFTLGLISAAFTTHSFGCSAVDAHCVQDSFEREDSTTSTSTSELFNISSENNKAKQEPIQSPDCGCPAHRIHCCDSQVMLDKIHRPHFATLTPWQFFFAESYAIKQAPHLEGPFQPPRS